MSSENGSAEYGVNCGEKNDKIAIMCLFLQSLDFNLERYYYFIMLLSRHVITSVCVRVLAMNFMFQHLSSMFYMSRSGLKQSVVIYDVCLCKKIIIKK